VRGRVFCWDSLTWRVFFSRKTEEERLPRVADSVALPAISTGLFRFPLERCATILFEEVALFCAARPRSRLRTVAFTNHDRPTCDALRQEARRTSAHAAYVQRELARQRRAAEAAAAAAAKAKQRSAPLPVRRDRAHHLAEDVEALHAEAQQQQQQQQPPPPPPPPGPYGRCVHLRGISQAAASASA
jgi:hypothetical protein